ncbi:MAG: 3-hydroxyacyl-ACP dehydratase FabZ, partial [Bdellovibrionales bacterium]|nr:3-hydroxyacyl-ACP dehydratase FabZ [Bdellovibrionales bacterium]
DRVVEFVDSKSITAIKNVTVNEPFFDGHFPQRPVMPGVMILEAMAQTGAIMALKSSAGVAPGRLLLLVGATDMKWKRQVTPGDTLKIYMEFIKRRAPLWILKGEVRVGEQLVASGTLSAIESDS